MNPAYIAVCTLPEMQYIVSQVIPHITKNKRNTFRKYFQMKATIRFIMFIKNNMTFLTPSSDRVGIFITLLGACFAPQ